MARSRQFIDGWRHSEKSLVAWLYNRSQCMDDPHAQGILDVAADDFGKWAKGRYRITGREGPPSAEDPLAVFRAAIRRDSLEEAARIIEDFERHPEPGVALLAEFQRRKISNAILAAKFPDADH
jgi:hypothetical protein